MKTKKTLRWLVLSANLVMMACIGSFYSFPDLAYNGEFLGYLLLYLVGCFCLHVLALVVGVVLLIPKRCRSRGKDLLAWLLKGCHTFDGEALEHDFWKMISGPGIGSAYSFLYVASWVSVIGCAIMVNVDC